MEKEKKEMTATEKRLMEYAVRLDQKKHNLKMDSENTVEQKGEENGKEDNEYR